MQGIYYKEGIYVLIDNAVDNDMCVYHNEWKYDVSLYGGRISIIKHGSKDAWLRVDGLLIKKIDKLRLEYYIPLTAITSHLNAIETNGVDAFLENYKRSIEFYYQELKELNQNTESLLSSSQDDSKVKSLLAELENIRTMLFSVLAILFNLYTFMKAGLENEKVISVYQSVIDSLA